jgi:3-hydroxymyristoyl/3-hydroxydecanoyl-(acyl carrier protein) dehydratase
LVRWYLIDQLLECEPGRLAVAVKTFPMSDFLFQTHFDANPVVPGVLHIEMMAQAAAKSLKILRPDQVTMLVNVKSAKFFRPVLPGDRCRVRVDIETRDQYAIESGVIDVDGIVVSRAELLVAFAPRVLCDPPERDPILEAWRRRHGGQDEPVAMGARADAASY